MYGDNAAGALVDETNEDDDDLQSTATCAGRSLDQSDRLANGDLATLDEPRSAVGSNQRRGASIEEDVAQVAAYAGK